MAKQNSVNLDITNNADGFEISGGTTSRTLGITGGNVTITGSGSATITFPSTTSTLATLDLSETFTNKTLTGPTANTSITLANQGELRFAEATGNGTNYVGFEAPSSITSNLIWVLPATDGSANQVLSTNGSGTLSWATASAGGGTKTYAVFTPLDNQPPVTNYATFDTRNSIATLDFDASTDESAVFVGIMPEAASLASGLKVRIHWMAATATSGTCRWGVQFEDMNTDLDSDSFDTAATAGSATNGTSGIITVTEITITTIDSIAAGDSFRLKVFRDADGTSGTDDMTGDAELVVVEVRSAS